MSIIIIIFCLIATITIAAYIYVRAMRGTSHRETVRILGKRVRSGANSVHSLYARAKGREYQFPFLMQAVEPFCFALEKDLHLCLRCQLWESYFVNQDVYFLSFKLLGVNASCEVAELKELLTTELQDVYIRTFGQVHPLVYPICLDRNIIAFWIAANLYGNTVIQQRAKHDYYADPKNPEVLEDE